MATVEKTVELIFHGVDNVTQTMGGIKGGLGDLDGMVQQIANPLANVAKGVLATDAALAAMAATLAGASVKAAGEFGDSFAEITTLFEASPQEVDKFRASILAYAQDSGKSLQDITASVYTAISAGTKYSDSIDLLTTSEKLSIAGRGDLEATTRLLASTLNAYGASTDEAGRYSDAFFVTVRDGLTTIPELANSLANVSNTAAAAGVPIETLMGGIAALTSSGMPTTQAITSIQQVIQSIIKPTDEAAKTAAALGIGFDAQTLAGKGLDGVLRAVTTATGGNVGEMTKLFGSVEALKGALVLGKDESGKFAGALVDMANKTGATATAAAKMADNYELAVGRLVNNVKVALIGVGQPLLEQFGDSTTALGDIFAGLSIGIDAGAFQPVFDALAAFSKQAAGYLEQVAQALPEALQHLDFRGLIDSLGSLGDTFAGLWEGIDLTTPEGLADAMQAAVDTIESLVDVTGGIVQAMAPVLGMIGEAVDRFNALGSDDKAAFGEKFLGNALLIQEAGTYIGAAIIAIGESGADIGRVFDGVGATLRLTVYSIQSAFVAAEVAVADTVWAIAKVLSNLTLGKIPVIEEMELATRSFAEAVTQDWLMRVGESGKALGDLGKAFAGAGGLAAASAKDVATVKPAVEAAGSAAESWAKIVEASGVKIGEAYAGTVDAFAATAMGLDKFAETAAETANTTADAASKTAAAVAGQKQSYEAAASAASSLVAEQLKQSGSTVDLNAAMATLEGATQGSTFALGGMRAETSKTSDVMKQAAVASEDLKFKLASLDADVAKTQMKLSVDLQVAKVQAETKQIEAAFASLGTSVTSTGDVIMNLFGQLGSAVNNNSSSGLSLQAMLKQQIADEEARRKASSDLQQQLTQAQIDAILLRNQLMQQGGGLIKIDSTGLEPALEMVMWNVIEKVQIAVNAQASEFLLGLP